MLTPNFTGTQQIGLPSCVYLTDDSTGSDVSIVARRAYVIDVENNYLVPTGTTTDYTVWPLVDTSISIDCLTQDTAAFVRVDWVDVGGAVVETKTILCDFRLYNLQESFQLTQAMVAQPNIIQDTNFWNNKMILRVNIDDSVEAVSIGGNQRVAQSALNRATAMTNNQSIYF